MRYGISMARVCKFQPEPTERQKAIALECQENGGTITADELAHSSAFDSVARAWTRARANAWISRERAQGRWLDAHCHGDGSIFVPSSREDSQATETG